MTFGSALASLRARRPLVQNITNFVAMQTMANVLLAAGASPAMVHAREEAAEFAGLAQALTLNTGTPEPDWVAAMEAAADVAAARAFLWCLTRSPPGRRPTGATSTWHWPGGCPD